MKALIHSRNFVSDYNPEFAVCDSSLTEDQKRWARGIIQSAVESFEKNSAPRYIIETRDSDVLAGVVCFTKDLSIDKKFSRDDKGRSIRVFIGCIFKRGEKKTSNLKLDRCAQLFGKYLESVWKVSRVCLESISSLFGKYLESVWKVSRVCLESEEFLQRKNSE